MADKESNSIKWCYFGENKDQVMMICSKQDWEALQDVLKWADRRVKDIILRESDDWNYGYTRANKRVE